MAYASPAIASPAVHWPRVAMPKLRWPWFSPRTRALLMMALMISPCFLTDTIGYWVKRMFYTQAQIVEMQSPESIMAKISMVGVACPATDTPAEQARWAAYAAENGWPSYPEAGPGCFKPNRNLHGMMGLTVFSVACPKMLLSALDQRRWLTLAADHGWTAYPQAGDGCVDP